MTHPCLPHFRAWAYEIDLVPGRGGRRTAAGSRVRWITADADTIVGRLDHDPPAHLNCADVILADNPRPGAIGRARALLDRFPGCALVVITRRRGRLTVLTRDGLHLRASHVDRRAPHLLETVMRALHEWWATRPPASLLTALACAPVDHHNHRSRHARLRIRCTPLTRNHADQPERPHHRRDLP